MIKTEDNYYRMMLQSVWGYPLRVLEGMDDEECDREYDYVVNRNNQVN